MLICSFCGTCSGAIRPRPSGIDCRVGKYWKSFLLRLAVTGVTGWNRFCKQAQRAIRHARGSAVIWTELINNVVPCKPKTTFYIPCPRTLDALTLTNSVLLTFPFCFHYYTHLLKKMCDIVCQENRGQACS